MKQESPPERPQEAYSPQRSLSGGYSCPIWGTRCPVWRGTPVLGILHPHLPLSLATCLTGVSPWERTRDQISGVPIRKGPVTSGTPPHLWTDTHLWEHYLPVVLRTRTYTQQKAREDEIYFLSKYFVLAQLLFLHEPTERSQPNTTINKTCIIYLESRIHIYVTVWSELTFYAFS